MYVVDWISSRLSNVWRGWQKETWISCWPKAWQAWYFTEATKAIAPMPPGQCLRALEMLYSRNLQFPHWVPFFTKEKMPWCPCPFKNEIYRPGMFYSSVLDHLYVVTHCNCNKRKEKVEKLTKYVEKKTIVSSCRISLTLCLTSCVSSFNLPIEVWRLKWHHTFSMVNSCGDVGNQGNVCGCKNKVTVESLKNSALSRWQSGRILKEKKCRDW